MQGDRSDLHHRLNLVREDISRPYASVLILLLRLLLPTLLTLLLLTTLTLPDPRVARGRLKRKTP